MIPLTSAFRDPCGDLYLDEGRLLRRVTSVGIEDYSLLRSSGLYDSLVASKLLIPHSEVEKGLLEPELVPFISYPYEWCFGQLKDAALVTLKIEETALSYGMTLKDASAYNIQFVEGRPILIDTLSLVRYQKGEPWVAYRQFCQHFLAPLTLMSYRDVRLSQLSRIHLDGIPLDLTSKLLPTSSYFRLVTLFHIHMHSRGQRLAKRPRKIVLSKSKLLGIIRHLRLSIGGLKGKVLKDSWADYGSCPYTEEELKLKQGVVESYLSRIRPKSVWDLGANTGVFSILASSLGAYTIAIDSDPSAVEVLYEKKVRGTLPLVIDLGNPSPGIGWDNTERASLTERGPTDMVLALALVHHLAIEDNLPLSKIAEFLCGICRYLVIEFVPKEDLMVKKMLSSRVDIFDNYSEEAFRSTFSTYFDILSSDRIGNSRVIFLMEKR